jgi:hypothetical protein
VDYSDGDLKYGHHSHSDEVGAPRRRTHVAQLCLPSRERGEEMRGWEWGAGEKGE